MYEHIIFDVDGTLIDNQPIIIESLEKALLELGIFKTKSEIKPILGLPCVDSLQILGVRDYEKTAKRWTEIYLENCHKNKLFNGIIEALSEIKKMGLNIGIVTSKTERELKYELKILNIEKFFDVKVTVELTRMHKPNPEPIEKYMELTGAKNHVTIYIGDTLHDMECAKNAKVSSALALWGSLNPKNIEATYYFETPKDLVELLCREHQNIP